MRLTRTTNIVIMGPKISGALEPPGTIFTLQGLFRGMGKEVISVFWLVLDAQIKL